MSTLYLDRRELALKLEGRALVIYASGERQGTVPTHLLDRIVMYSAVALDSSLLARLADDGIAIQLHGGQHGAKVALVHGRGQGDATRRIGQYRAYEDDAWRQRWARLLVLAKVKGQVGLLRQALAERPEQRRPLTQGLERLGQARERLRQESQPAIDRLRGLEGAAAAAYFQAYGVLFAPGLGFAGRNRRPPRDPVNAVLSLGYTLLHGEAVRACQTAGLDPLIGFFHELDPGRESLACDLVEPLRPRVDAWVWSLFRTEALREDHFDRHGEACLLGKAGRGHFYAAFESLAPLPRRWLRRVTRRLAQGLHERGRVAIPSEMP
jgi:CRISPR-associated protein Cas1